MRSKCLAYAYRGNPQGGRIVQSGVNGLQFDDWMLLKEEEKLSERMLFNKRKRNPDNKFNPRVSVNLLLNNWDPRHRLFVGRYKSNCNHLFLNKVSCCFCFVGS